MIEIKHNGETYNLNVDKAIKDGYLSKKVPPFKLNAGDVFLSKYGIIMVAIRHDSSNPDLFSFIGQGGKDNIFSRWLDAPVNSQQFYDNFVKGSGSFKYIGNCLIAFKQSFDVML